MEIRFIESRWCSGCNESGPQPRPNPSKAGSDMLVMKPDTSKSRSDMLVMKVEYLDFAPMAKELNAGT